MDFARSIPTLYSLSLAETQTFYETSLRFKCEVVGQDYLIAKRDDMELHFSLTEQEDLPKQSTCYIRGGQVTDLYEEFLKGNLANLSDFSVRAWDMKEFHILDPHGNLLRFGCCP